MLPLISLDGVTTPGVGAAKDLESVFSKHTLLAVETGGGSFSDLAVRLEGSHDGQNWIRLASVTVTPTSGPVISSIDQHLVRHVRAALDEPVSGSFVLTASIASGD